MKKQNMVRADMIDYTNLSYEPGKHKPQTKDWIAKHCEGKYHLASTNKAGGSTKRLKDVPGYKDELRRNPGKQTPKRTWEDNSYPARGNSTASSSNEPRYHASTAGSSTDTRRIKARSESTDYVERRRIEDWWGYPSYDDQDERLPGETSLGEAVRLESRDYVQQRSAAGHRLSPAYGEQ